MQQSSPAYQEGFGLQSAYEDAKWMANCPDCSAMYGPIESRIVAEKEVGYLLYHDCGSCKNTLFTAVIERKDGMEALGMITDLTYYDASRFRNATSITSDQILDAYIALKAFSPTRVKVMVHEER